MTFPQNVENKIKYEKKNAKLKIKALHYCEAACVKYVFYYLLAQRIGVKIQSDLKAHCELKHVR